MFYQKIFQHILNGNFVLNNGDLKGDILGLVYIWQNLYMCEVLVYYLTFWCPFLKISCWTIYIDDFINKTNGAARQFCMRHFFSKNVAKSQPRQILVYFLVGNRNIHNGRIFQIFFKYSYNIYLFYKNWGACKRTTLSTYHRVYLKENNCLVNCVKVTESNHLTWITQASC